MSSCVELQADILFVSSLPLFWIQTLFCFYYYSTAKANCRTLTLFPSVTRQQQTRHWDLLAVLTRSIRGTWNYSLSHPLTSSLACEVKFLIFSFLLASITPRAKTALPNLNCVTTDVAKLQYCMRGDKKASYFFLMMMMIIKPDVTVFRSVMVSPATTSHQPCQCWLRRQALKQTVVSVTPWCFSVIK